MMVVDKLMILLNVTNLNVLMPYNQTPGHSISVIGSNTVFLFSVHLF